MTPINNSNPAPKPGPPAWQLWALRVIMVAVTLYVIFHVIIPDYRARQALIDGPTPQSSAPAH